MKDLVKKANVETMSSTQISEMLGYEKKEVNKKIRSMFDEVKARELFSPAFDTQGRVLEYHLPELESKMFVAKHDITYLEKITQFWIDQNKPVQEATQITRGADEIAKVACIFADSLRVNEGSRILMYHKAMESIGVDSSFLPAYTEEKVTQPATALIKANGFKLSTAKFNTLMVQAGMMEIKERSSGKGGGIMKEYKSLTEVGLKYGKNLINPNNQRETQPHYFADSFVELYNLVQD